ncbi:MAG: cupredoxin domain-containing protein [Pseudomonadota bacterium]
MTADGFGRVSRRTARTRRAPWPVLAALVCGLLVVAAGCGSGYSSSGTATTGSTAQGAETTIAGTAANAHGTKDVRDAGEASLELDDSYFAPTVLQGTPGQRLTVELENEGAIEHNFSIDDQSLDQDVDPGGKATVTVTFPDSGVVRFYCKYHEGTGMVGGLQAGSGRATDTGGSTTGGGAYGG